MKFTDIKKLTNIGNYSIDVSWISLERHLERWISEKHSSLDLNPDFQRAHVWNEKQQKMYVEFKLRGGNGADELILNCNGWMDDFRGPFVLVDGKQRLEAVRKFLRGELAIFHSEEKPDGYTINDFEDKLKWNPKFTFSVNNLKTREEVLRWYLELNTGGTVHTDEEINKVKQMLDEIKGE